MKNGKKSGNHGDEEEEEEEAQYETQVLEKAIIKIGHLLAIGLGDAGAKIIASNIGA